MDERDAPGDAEPRYGDGDATFRAAGGEEGIRRLVEDFYAEMQRLPEAQRILRMHPPDLEISIDKLARFLCGWTGGPKRYSEKYGPIQIPVAHRHLAIGEEERDAWLLCMTHALDRQPYPDALKRYLLKELFVPAERIRQAVARRREERQERAGRAAGGGDD